MKKLSKATLDGFKKKENREVLRKFVMSHMIKGTYSAEQLCEMGVITNLNCIQYQTNVCNNRLQVGKAAVIAPNVKTKNGMVHVIDTPLVSVAQ